MILNYSILAACQYNSTELKPNMWDEFAKTMLAVFIENKEETTEE